MKMKKLLLISLVLALGIHAGAQTQQLVQGTIQAQASSCTPTASSTACVFLQVSPQTNSADITVAGTYSGTLQFEVSGDGGATWVAVNATPPNSTTAVTSTTSTGTWTASMAGHSFLRVRCSSYTSGGANVTLNPSQAVIASTGGGSGGSGTVTSVTFTGDGTILSATPSSAVTSTGTLLAAMANAGAGTILNNATGSSATPTYTSTPVLGKDGVTGGTLQTANGLSSAHTIWGSAATTSNVILGFTAVPTNGHLVTCTVSGSSCTLTDGGAVTSGTVTSIATSAPLGGGTITTTGTLTCTTCVTASSPGAGIAHFAGSTQAVTSSPIVAADITSGTITSTQLAAGLATRSIAFQFGTPGGSAISTGVLGYLTVPFACTIGGWSIQVDAGTATVKTLKVAAGTAIPTLGSNSISTSGVAISTGTVIQSTTVTDFTTTTVTANDIVAADLTATSGVGYIAFQLVCAQ